VGRGQAKGPPLTHHDRVRAVALSGDGRTALTGSSDRTARLWDVASGQAKGPPLTHDDRVRAVALSGDGRTALTGCEDKMARLWFLPETVEGSIQQIQLWVDVITRLEMDEAGGFHLLSADEWERKRGKLQTLGGPRLIGVPIAPAAAGSTP
jgi:hypothetical protein